VRQAFKQVAATDNKLYQVIDANQSIDAVTEQVFDTVNRQFQLSLKLNKGIE
jgi:thymidylate kinase